MTSDEMRRRIARRARRFHVDLPGETARWLADYVALLQFWNRKVNLTALLDPDQLVDRLVLEPVAAARFLDPKVCAVMDVGSGGGSPAIPLKICAPRIRLWMVESKTRKAAFLREATRQLGLASVEVETRRFEELLPRPDLYEAMDLVTVRAVRLTVPTLLRLQAFVRAPGQVWLFTGRGRTEQTVPPPLAFEGEEPLLDHLGSCLWRLRKTPPETGDMPAAGRDPTVAGA